MKKVGPLAWEVKPKVERAFELFLTEVMGWEPQRVGPLRDVVRYVAPVDIPEKRAQRYLGTVGILCDLGTKPTHMWHTIKEKDVRWFTARALEDGDDAALWILMHMGFFSLSGIRAKRTYALGTAGTYCSLPPLLIRLPTADAEAYGFYRSWLRLAARCACAEYVTGSSFIACLRMVVPMGETKQKKRIAQNTVAFQQTALTRAIRAFHWCVSRNATMLTPQGRRIIEAAGALLENHWGGVTGDETCSDVRMVWHTESKLHKRSLAYEFLTLYANSPAYSESLMQTLVLNATPFDRKGAPIEVPLSNVLRVALSVLGVDDDSH